jgi:hypothetical protein
MICVQFVAESCASILHYLPQDTKYETEKRTPIRYKLDL